MDVISARELALYLGEDETDSLRLKVILTNGLIAELPYSGTFTVSTRAKTIALEVAGRAVRNPDGYQTDRIDDSSGTRPAATAAAGVYLTPDEREELLALGAAAGTYRGTAYTVRVRGAGDLVP